MVLCRLQKKKAMKTSTMQTGANGTNMLPTQETPMKSKVLNYNWPQYLSQMLVFFLMFIGASINCQTAKSQARWSKISSLPDGGRVVDMATDNSGTIYVLANYTGDIYYTTNNGQSWQQVQGTQAFWNVVDIEVDKVSKALYVGTTGSGIYWTNNYGATWQQEYIYTDQVSGFHASLDQIACKNGTGVVVGHEGTLTPPSNIYTSANAGTSWNTYQAPFLDAGDLLFLPNGSLLAGTEQGVFKSSNNGSSWTAINTGISNMYIKALAHKSSNSYLFAGAYANMSTQDTTGAGVYVSTDNGATWNRASYGITDKRINALLVDSATGNVYAGTEGGIYMSTNNGSTWTAVNVNLQNLTISAIVENPTGFFAGSEKSGVSFATNPSTGWTYKNAGVAINSLVGMVMDNSGMFHIIDGDVTGIYRKSVKATAWQQAGTNQLPAFGGTKILKDKSGTLYAAFSTRRGFAKKGVFKSTDGGTTWTDISSTIPLPSSLAWVSFKDIEVGPGAIYVYANGQIYKSVNSGTSWTSIKQFTSSTFVDMDVASNGDLYVQSLPGTLTPAFEVSKDMGVTFTNVAVNASIFLSESVDLIIDRTDSLYLNQNNIIYKRNGINNWVQLSNGGWDVNGPYARDMKVYFDNLNGIYVSAREEGIFYSPNGTTWTNISTGIPTFNSSSVGLIQLTLIDLCFDKDNTPYARTYDVEGGTLLGIYKHAVPTGIKSPAQLITDVSIYPNPATTKAMVSFVTERKSALELALIDNQGKTVKMISVTPSTVGLNRQSIDISDLTKGVYYLKVYGENMDTIQRFVKL